MYENLFDEKSQELMREFFIHKLAPLGTSKTCLKNEVINNDYSNHIGIVTEGKLKQIMYAHSGDEKVLFFLSPGEIFGETSYFCTGDMPIILKSCCESKFSFVNRCVVDEILYENPFAYNFFMHSLIRKYRISLSQMHDLLFTTTKQKVANTLYRLYVQSGIKDSNVIDIKFTHQELANLVGASRITITRILKDLRDNDVIDFTNDKKIIIKDLNKLSMLMHI